MNKMSYLQKYSLRICWMLILWSIGNSCSTTDEFCREEKNVKLKMSFYTRNFNSNTQKYVNSSLSVDSLTIVGIDSLGQLIDSVLYNNSKNISSVKLPLNKFSKESKFLLILNDELDTITIHYTNHLQYLSFECGSIITHTIDTVYATSHFIDSLTIVEPDITTLDVENLQIFHY